MNQICLEDLPWVARLDYANNASAIDLASNMPYHVDIPRLRKGKVGGFFWYASRTLFLGVSTAHPGFLYARSVYADCPDPESEGEDFLNATWRVR